MSMRGGEILAVSAVGSVRPTLSVDGFSEANTALNSIDKPEDWNQSPRQICELRQQSVDRESGAYTSPRAVLLRSLARPLLLKAPLAYGVAAIAAVVAEITVAEAARHQVVAVVALGAQVAIRTVAHPVSPSCLMQTRRTRFGAALMGHVSY